MNKATPSSHAIALTSRQHLQQTTWEILDGDPTTHPQLAWIDTVIVAVIVANVLAVVVGTVPAIRARFGMQLDAFETISVCLFVVEYLARLWSVPCTDPEANPWRTRARWVLTPLALADAAAIVPFFLSVGVTDLRLVRLARLVRLLRIGKLARYFAAFRLIALVLSDKKRELIAVGASLVVMLLLASSVIFAVEHDVQPDKFSSIPAAMWWGVATMTTVGYGDVYPITVLGKLVGSIVAVVGIAFFALPAAIIGAGFLERFLERAAAGRVDRCCPHCGGVLNGEREKQSSR